MGVLFASGTLKEEIPELLEIFQEVRHNRAAAIQCLSNVGYDEAGTAGRLLERYITGPAPSMSRPSLLDFVYTLCNYYTDRFTETFVEVHQFNFGYDIMLEAEAELARYRMANLKVEG